MTLTYRTQSRKIKSFKVCLLEFLKAIVSSLDTASQALTNTSYVQSISNVVYFIKASGGIFPLFFSSPNTTADLSKSQWFSSRHLTDQSTFIPDFAEKLMASVCFAAWSSGGGEAREVLGEAAAAAAAVATASRLLSAEVNAFSEFL